jgi:hypothetical protein
MTQTIAEWLATQPTDVQELIRPQVEALQHSLRAARDERDAALKQAKPSADQAELQNQLTAKDRRIAFLEGASTKGVKDAKLAWALANTEGTFKEDGGVDWAKLKELSPSLFNAPLKTGAGSGTENLPKPPRRLQDAFKRGTQSKEIEE